MSRKVNAFTAMQEEHVVLTMVKELNNKTKAGLSPYMTFNRHVKTHSGEPDHYIFIGDGNSARLHLTAVEKGMNSTYIALDNMRKEAVDAVSEKIKKTSSR